MNSFQNKEINDKIAHKNNQTSKKKPKNKPINKAYTFQDRVCR